MYSDLKVLDVLIKKVTENETKPTWKPSKILYMFTDTEHSICC